MPPVQTTFTQVPTPVAYEGQIHNMGRADIISGFCDVAAGIPFGRFVTRATADNRFKLPTTTGEVQAAGNAPGAGFTVQMTGSQEAVNGYVENQDMSIMRDGLIWLDSEEAVNYGDTVFVRFASGAGGTLLGKVRKSADTATAVALPGASFRGTIAAAGLVLVEFHPQTS